MKSPGKRACELDTVIERIRAMLQAGTIRRVRQTLLATNLAQGALVAWQVPAERLDAAFDYMFQQDPFSGHVVLRSTDSATAGSNYKLWTTLKVPQGFSMRDPLPVSGAGKPARNTFASCPPNGFLPLAWAISGGAGWSRAPRRTCRRKSRRSRSSGSTRSEWRILTALKREFEPEEIVPDIWRARAAEAGVPLEDFYRMAEDFNRRKIIGRFSTFLEHVKTAQ